MQRFDDARADIDALPRARAERPARRRVPSPARRAALTCIAMLRPRPRELVRRDRRGGRRGRPRRALRRRRVAARGPRALRRRRARARVARAHPATSCRSCRPRSTAPACRSTELDGIAVTNAPGLVGALLVGLQTAKAIAWVTGKPLVGVHHLEGHLSAIFLEPDPPPMPHLALIVSGGHTSLVRVDDHGVRRRARRDARRRRRRGVRQGRQAARPRLSRRRRDRSAREGPAIRTAVAFPRAMTAERARLRLLVQRAQDRAAPSRARARRARRPAARRSVRELPGRDRRGARAQDPPRGAPRADSHHVQVCGGVAANSALRAALIAAGAEDDFRVYVPPPARCTDNAAMIAARATTGSRAASATGSTSTRRRARRCRATRVTAARAATAVPGRAHAARRATACARRRASARTS